MSAHEAPLPRGARQPTLWLDLEARLWTPVHTWGRAGDPGTLDDAREALGLLEGDACRVVVWQGRRRVAVHERIGPEAMRALEATP